MLKAGLTAAVISAILCCLALSFALYSGYIAPGASWQRDLPAYPQQGAQRWARAIIHMHSVYSHDACDRHPIEDGRINQQCLADLREAVCRDHIDILFLTEHWANIASTDFNSLLNPRNDDSLLWQDGHIIGSVQHCSDGHEVHLFPGAEDYVMPIGLLRHPEGREYSGMVAANRDNLRRAGALIALSHVEQPLMAVGQILAMRPDLMEVYNLHANLAATARRRNKWLVAKRFFRFLQFLPSRYLEPDLLFLTFFSEDEIALAKWGQVTRETHVTGIAGTDAHQNALPWKMSDGERMDSYRRTMRWFSNFVQVDELTRDAILAALKAGKVFMAFEIFGTPEAFAFSAARNGKQYAMGETLEIREGEPATFSVKLPTLLYRDPSAPRPEMVLRILRATKNGWEEVKQSKDLDLIYETSLPGAYRAEVRIKPNHLAPFLLGAQKLIGYRPWIYSNPIYLR